MQQPKRRKTTRSATSDTTSSRTEHYARRVVAREIPAGELVRLACQRHLDDLATGAGRGLWFDHEAEARHLGFYKYLRHSKGEWQGQTFELSDWQAFIVGSIYGWKNADGTRRYRTAYCEVPRKNGKSTLLGGVSLYALTADGEPGAEVYACATKKDQARIVFNESRAMVKASEELSKRIRSFVSNMHVPATGSKYEPLAADSGTLDGLNIHLAANDEVHAWANRDLYDVIETAMGARRQPLVFNITTAGKNEHGVCWDLREYAVSVLRGIFADDSFFAYIATIDPEDLDRWDQPDVWAKANPNYGVSVKERDMELLATKARQMPAAKAAFLRLRLNVWTFGIDGWLPYDKWQQGAAPIDLAALAGRDCYAGVDLSSTTDISSVALVFPPDSVLQCSGAPPQEGGLSDWVVLWRYYMPAANLAERAAEDRVPYTQWRDQGLITATPGNVIDYEYIRRDINALQDQYNIREIAIDRWNASHITTLLGEDGFTVVPFGQGYASMSGPSKHFEGLVLSGGLRHGGNPVSDWMSGNVVLMDDDAGNIKPTKRRSRGRIDGIVAAIMALGRAIAPREEEDAGNMDDYFASLKASQ